MTHIDEATLHAFLDKCLSKKSEAKVNAHISGCPSCQKKARELCELFDALGQLPVEPPPSNLTSRILKARKVDRPVWHERLNLAPIFSGRLGISAVAAGLLVGILLGLSLAFVKEPLQKEYASGIWIMEEAPSDETLLVADAGDIL